MSKIKKWMKDLYDKLIGWIFCRLYISLRNLSLIFPGYVVYQFEVMREEKEKLVIIPDIELNTF